MNLGYIRAMRHEAQQAASRAPQYPNTFPLGQTTAPTPKGREKAKKDPHGHLPVDEALRADVEAMCKAGAMDTPATEQAAVEAWAEFRCLGLRTAWALWVTYAAASACHHTPFFALTVAGKG